MALLQLDSSWLSSTQESFNYSFSVGIEEGNPADFLPMLEVSTSSSCQNSNIPKPPPCPGSIESIRTKSTRPKRLIGYRYVPKETESTWDKLFREGYGADVHILTVEKAVVPAHSCVLGIASPVLRNVLEQAKVKDGIQYIKIPGIPVEAIRVFIRFIYSSRYDQEDMKKFVLHLLVLSHCFSIPSLKRVCVNLLEQGWLTKENVIDVLQLSRKCDAPRLSLICIRLIVKDFKTIAATEGWRVMKQTNPALEQELLESVVEADSRKQEKLKKTEEKKVYLQLHEAMEALLHICKDGCKMIGPRDKVLKANHVSCGFPACKGLEALVRHFSGCKTRVPGGCVHCKRMWQLLKLHSHMCNDPPNSCKVPLCRHFKEKTREQCKNEEEKWKLLVSKIIAAKRMMGPCAQPVHRHITYLNGLLVGHYIGM